MSAHGPGGFSPEDVLPSEDAWVGAILGRLGRGSPLLVPPGSDCGAAEVDGRTVVLTTDVLVDGVHFSLARDGAEAAGRKALLVNLSDLAAAASIPVAYEVGVVLPEDDPGALATALAAGLDGAGRRWSCPCAGGDTNVGPGPLVVSVTAVGRAGPLGVVTRRGARPGDVLSVTGPLGGSLAGRHLDFTPRLDEAQALARLGIPHAMMDLSDGLSRDLPRLCQASGVGATLDAARVPIHADVRGFDDGRSPLEHALDDGEDFELLVAHAPLDDAAREALAAAGVTLLPVGRVTAAARGLRLARDGSDVPLAARGYDHFARRARRGLEHRRPEVRVTRSSAETRALGAALGRAARAAAADGILVALNGELGAGKTVFVGGVAEGLGLAPAHVIVSPTFTIARSYGDGGPGEVVLHHVDAYRLSGADDLEAAGFEDMCGKGRLTCVEWAERVEDAMPADRLDVTIEMLAPTTGSAPGAVPEAPRRITLRAGGPRARAVLARLGTPSEGAA